MQNVNRQLSATGKKLQGVGTNLSVGLTAPLALLGAASLKAFDTQAKAIAQVETGLKTTGNQVGKTSQQLQAMASELQNNSLFGDEDILQNATAQLLTFTNIAGDQFARTQQAALDLSTRLDGDLKSASIQLGKALNDPVANLSALSKSGIQFSTAQKETINALAKTNRLAEAQTLILDELEKQYGGSAAAAAKAGTGPLKQLGNILGDITEEFGAIIAEGIAPFVAYLKDLALKFQSLSPETKKFIVVLAGILAAIGPVLLAVGTFVKFLPVLSSGLSALGGPVTLLIAGLAAVAIMIIKNWAPIKKMIIDIANYFIDLYNESVLLRIAVQGVGLAFKGIYNIAVFVFDALGSVVTLFIDNVKSGFKGLGQVIKGVFTLDYETIENGLSNAFDGAKESVGDFVKNIKNDFDKLGNSIGEDVSKAINNVIQREPIKFISENIDTSEIEAAVSKSVNDGIKNGGSGDGRGQVAVVPTLSAGLQELPDTPLTGILQQLPKQREQVNQELLNFQLSLLDFEQQSAGILEGAAESFAVGFGNIIAGIAQGANPIQGLVTLILNTIGDLLQQLGKAAISIGITMTGIKKAFTSPIGAIAAGVAAIALGAIIKSFIPDTFAGSFANGGVVGGNSFTGDKLFARINSGEMVLNQKQQANLSGMLASSNAAQPLLLDGSFVVTGDQLRLILDRSDKRKSRIG